MIGRWRKCQRKSSASLFILVQIQVGPPITVDGGAKKNRAIRRFDIGIALTLKLGRRIRFRSATKKPRTMPGPFSCEICTLDQYFATTGPPQLKR